MAAAGSQAFGVAIGIMVFIVLWTAVGIAANATGIAIYDSFPRVPFYPNAAYTITIKNNAPTINPLIVPLYFASVQTTNASCAIMGASSSCSQYLWDLGRIDPGGSSTLTFIIQPSSQNFTMAVHVYLNMWNSKIDAGGRTIHFQYLRNGTYLEQG
jgi:hypothetical protein